MRKKKKAVRPTYGDPIYRTAGAQIDRPNSPHWYSFTVHFAVRLCLETRFYHVFRYKSIKGRRIKMPFIDRRGNAFARAEFAEAYADRLLSYYLKRGAKKVYGLADSAIENRLLSDLEDAASDLEDAFETVYKNIDSLIKAARKVRKKYGIR